MCNLCQFLSRRHVLDMNLQMHIPRSPNVSLWFYCRSATCRVCFVWIYVKIVEIIVSSKNRWNWRRRSRHPKYWNLLCGPERRGSSPVDDNNCHILLSKNMFNMLVCNHYFFLRAQVFRTIMMYKKSKLSHKYNSCIFFWKASVALMFIPEFVFGY